MNINKLLTSLNQSITEFNLLNVEKRDPYSLDKIKVFDKKNDVNLQLNNTNKITSNLDQTYGIPEFDSFYAMVVNSRMSFINSVISLIDIFFLGFTNDKRKKVIEDFCQKMGYALDGKELYKKFNYKKLKINKLDLQSSLLKGNFKNKDEFFRYLSDYKNICILIYDIQNNNIYKILSSVEVGTVKNILLMKNRDIYHPMFKDNGSCYVVEDDHILIKNCLKEKRIDIINDKVNISINMKLSELQDIAKDQNINIQKPSSKTNNWINKTKKELYNELNEKLINN
jgi:hypothetical protein